MGSTEKLESAFGPDSKSVWESAGPIVQCFHECLTCLLKIYTGVLSGIKSGQSFTKKFK